MKVFLAVAEEGSITKAAQRLGYVQSNVTARIHQLESELHTKLFYRHRRGVQLTPLGDTILPYAKKILNLCQQMQALVQDDSNPSGPLRIGSMETTSAIRLPEIFTTYHNAYSNVELVLVTGPTADLLRAVLDYQIDGAFVSSPIDHPDIVQEASVQEELVLIANKTEALRLPLCIQEHKLLVFRNGCSYRMQLEKWLNDEGIFPKNVMEFGTLDGIVGCVRAGLGVSLIPKSVVQHFSYSDKIAYYPIPEKYRFVKTVFIRRKDALVTPALRRFVETVRHHFRSP